MRFSQPSHLEVLNYVFASVGNSNRMDLKEFSVIEAFEGLKLTIQMWSRFFKVKDFVLLA